MNRAVDLSLARPVVTAECLKSGVTISAVEPLPSGGTHLVCATAHGADAIRQRFQDHVMTGKAKRFPFYRGPP